MYHFRSFSIHPSVNQMVNNMNYTAQKVSIHPNQKLADVRKFVCNYRRNTCSQCLMALTNYSIIRVHTR